MVCVVELKNSEVIVFVVYCGPIVSKNVLLLLFSPTKWGVYFQRLIKGVCFLFFCQPDPSFLKNDKQTVQPLTIHLCTKKLHMLSVAPHDLTISKISMSMSISVFKIIKSCVLLMLAVFNRVTKKAYKTVIQSVVYKRNKTIQHKKALNTGYVPESNSSVKTEIKVLIKRWWQIQSGKIPGLPHVKWIAVETIFQHHSFSIV